MAYQVTHADQRGVRLRRTHGSYGVVALFLLAAVGLLVLGLVPWHGKQRLHAVLLLCGAVIAATVPALIVRRRLRLEPHEIVFDNERAVVAVIQGGGRGRSDGVRGFIPYQDVRGFDIRGESHGERSSEGSVSDHAAFVLAFERQDGARWDLGDFASVEQATALRDLLRQHVTLGKRCERTPAGPLPKHIRAQISSTSVALFWPSRSDVEGVALALIGLLALLGVLLTVALDEYQAAGQLSGLTLGMFVFEAALLGGFAWHQRRRLRTGHRITIDRDQVEVARIEGPEHVVERAATPLRQVVGVRFDFGKDTGPAPLRMWLAADADTEERLPEASLSFDRLQLLFGVALQERGIEVSALTTAERLSLENHLNRVLRARFAPGWQTTLRESERQYAQTAFWWDAPA